MESKQSDFPEWTLCAEGYPASRSQAPPPGGPEGQMMTVGSGLKCAELFRGSGLAGSLLKRLLCSTDLASRSWFLIWKPTNTKFSRRLKFRLVPSDTITGGHASGLSATPTATANQGAPSMQKHPGCRLVADEIDPDIWEIRMGFPLGWTDLEPLATPLSHK